MKQTSWPDVTPINQKNYYTYVLLLRITLATATATASLVAIVAVAVIRLTPLSPAEIT